jgi:hypothetical protein
MKAITANLHEPEARQLAAHAKRMEWSKRKMAGFAISQWLISNPLPKKPLTAASKAA